MRIKYYPNKSTPTEGGLEFKCANQLNQWIDFLKQFRKSCNNKGILQGILQQGIRKGILQGILKGMLQGKLKGILKKRKNKPERFPYLLVSKLL